MWNSKRTRKSGLAQDIYIYIYFFSANDNYVFCFANKILPKIYQVRRVIGIVLKSSGSQSEEVDSIPSSNQAKILKRRD